MTRKLQSRSAVKRKQSTVRIVFYVLSIIIVLSMAIGFVIDVVATPSAYQTGTPTPVVLPSAGPS
jgi:hypothetical protein